MDNNALPDPARGDYEMDGTLSQIVLHLYMTTKLGNEHPRRGKNIQEPDKTSKFRAEFFSEQTRSDGSAAARR